jgi:hypothetical protein
LNSIHEFSQIFAATEDRILAQQANRKKRVWARGIGLSFFDVGSIAASAGARQLKTRIADCHR